MGNGKVMVLDESVTRFECVGVRCAWDGDIDVEGKIRGLVWELVVLLHMK